MPRRPAHRAVFPLLAALLLALTGCRSPQQHRRAADEAAYRILDAQRKALLDRSDPFRIDAPADRLRRRLLLDQKLPTAFAASLGIQDVDPIPELVERGLWQEAQTAREDAPARKTTLPRSRPPDGQQAPLSLSLEQALQIAARGSREYQQRKEDVFLAALDLDLERDAFRSTWEGLLSGEIEADLSDGDTDSWADGHASLQLSRLFASGAKVTAGLGVNLVKLLAGGDASSLGIFGDGSVSIPLMRGSGRFVVTEPMKQAERNVTYALYEFERFKRTFAVRVASDYLGVLQQRDRLRNAEENYRGLIASARRARRLADMGRLPEIQVDQAVQDELRARDRWIAARQALDRSRDSFRMLLGLPVDAAVIPDPGELDALDQLAERLAPADESEPASPDAKSADDPISLDPPTRAGGGPYEIDPAQAIRIAFDNRLDLRVAIGRIDDAQRDIVVAADNLRADLTLLGGVTVGERRSAATAADSNAQLRFDRGIYSGLLDLDLPVERTAERNQYRKQWIELERAVRTAQQLEDQIKLDVRDRLRVLLEAREAVRIQMRALEVARRRVRGTDLFLEQGRAEIRDVLEARESLVSAENALTAAIVRYRVAELEFQRDLGVLHVDPNGLWTEYDPEASGDEVQ